MRVKLKDYTRADCSCCGTEQAVFSKGITPCSECGKLLFPCNACQECLYQACPFDGKTNEELKLYINEAVQKDVSDKVLRIFNRQTDRRIRWRKWRRWLESKFEKEDTEWLPF